MSTLLRVVAFSLFAINSSFSSNITDNSVSTSNDTVNKIEEYILLNQLDSAIYLMPQQKSSSYINSLERIAKNENPEYIDFNQFITRIENRTEIGYSRVSNFINNNIKEPSKSKKIDLDYINIKWTQVSKLRDEVTIEEASKVQGELENYIDIFDSNDEDVVRAKILSSTHQIVLYVIQKEVEKGKILCEENFEIAKKLNDKKLMIISLYYLCDFLIHEGKLDEYISTCEQSLEIENTLQNKSSYYSGTLIHIIDAYIYKGGNDGRIQTLLKELYENRIIRPQSYSLYAKYLGTLDLNSTSTQDIFSQFKVADLIEFCNKAEKSGEESLNPNDLYQLQREISNTLEIHGFLKEAIAFKDKTVILIKRIYSQDLANSLANYKTNEALRDKNIELENQRLRNKLYIIIASLVTILLLITVLLFMRKRKQSRILELKNNEINKTLKEKELLVREVHHRVKNNFQIVSSLLELQTRGIEDKKALMLANEGQNRVKSMALIHQKLYQNEDGLIDFNEYIHLLVKELTSLFVSKTKVDTKVVADDMRFDVDTAIPLGLIINELITNAYKYAFTDNKPGKLDITINRVDKDNYKLIVSDNGPGLENEFNLKKAKSLGLRLVNRLVKQLQGTLALDNNEGANFEITFKDIHARKSIN